MEKLCLTVLLVFLGLHFVVCSKADEVEFKMRIKERGSRFNEVIRISEKENTVSFMVPKHNDVDRSDVRNDFNLNLTITRLPDVGICHIKPLKRGLPSPRKMKSDMNYIKNANARMRKQGTMVSSSEWTYDKQMKPKDLSPSVVKFCAGLPIYRLKEITNGDWEIVKGNDTVSRRKRQQLGYQLCPNSYMSKNCPPNQWVINCQFVVSGTTCVYWMTCTVPIINVGNDLRNCKFSHDWSAVMCCKPTCPTG